MVFNKLFTRILRSFLGVGALASKPKFKESSLFEIMHSLSNNHLKRLCEYHLEPNLFKKFGVNLSNHF
jgi:hypothetical protein